VGRGTSGDYNLLGLVFCHCLKMKRVEKERLQYNQTLTVPAFFL
jgi:hypothetical protein